MLDEYSHWKALRSVGGNGGDYNEDRRKSQRGT